MVQVVKINPVLHCPFACGLKFRPPVKNCCSRWHVSSEVVLTGYDLLQLAAESTENMATSHEPPGQAPHLEQDDPCYGQQASGGADAEGRPAGRQPGHRTGWLVGFSYCSSQLFSFITAGTS